MIVGTKLIDKYLEDYRQGKIVKGLSIDCPDLDHVIRFKKGQLNCVNGLDNVGKTAWVLWYFLCLAVKHNLKFDIYSGENSPNMLVRQLIEFYNGKKLKETEQKLIYSSKEFIYEHFNFIDYKGFYKLEDLIEIFKGTDSDGCLIDPFTGLNREYTHASNYDFLNTSRRFVNETGKTMYFNTHPNTEAARSVWGDNCPVKEWRGYSKPPARSQSEGGQPFANRVDDYLTIHRMVGHPDYGLKTQVFSRKVKDTETGGEVCAIDSPVWFDWNYGCGFTCNGINPLNSNTSPF